MLPCFWRFSRVLGVHCRRPFSLKNVAWSQRRTGATPGRLGAHELVLQLARHRRWLALERGDDRTLVLVGQGAAGDFPRLLPTRIAVLATPLDHFYTS